MQNRRTWPKGRRARTRDQILIQEHEQVEREISR